MTFSRFSFIYSTKIKQYWMNFPLAPFSFSNVTVLYLSGIVRSPVLLALFSCAKFQKYALLLLYIDQIYQMIYLYFFPRLMHTNIAEHCCGYITRNCFLKGSIVMQRYIFYILGEYWHQLQNKRSQGTFWKIFYIKGVGEKKYLENIRSLKFLCLAP